MRRVLTDTKLAALKPAKPGKRYDLLDALMPGLLVCVTSTGHKSFMFRSRRFPGKPFPSRRLLGEVGAMKVAEARLKAKSWHELLERGIDPVWQAEQDKLAALRLKQDNFLTVAEAYFAYIQREGLRNAAKIERELRNEFVKRWAARPVADIGKDDVAAVVTAAVQRGSPGQAHMLFERIRTLFAWALGTGAYGLLGNPCAALKPAKLIGRKKSRQRILSHDEIRALWQATESEDYPWQPLYRLLLLTGARLTEVTDATWAEFDLAHKLWVVPAERYKTGSAQVVPLVPAALALLESLPQFASGDFVFSANWGKNPVRGLSKPKLRLDNKMKAALGTLEPWVVHDLRRTMRSELSALPIEQHVREIVIGHVQPGVKGVYDRYAYVDEKRRALELWTARLRSIVEPAPDNVVALRTEALQ